MKHLVLLTGHFPQQKRRSSLLWVTNALLHMGWHVTHVTVGYSWLSRLRRDRRLRALDSPPRAGTWQLQPRHRWIFHYAPLHPFSTRRPLLDQMLAPLHHIFPAYWTDHLRAPMAQADLVLVESGTPVMLAPLLRRLSTRARLIYRVNDDIRLLNAPAFLCQCETDNAPLFDRISTASPYLAAQFQGLAPVTIDPMGVPLERLHNIGPDPYTDRAKFEAVCAGSTQLDIAALLHIAKARPNWRLHVLGRLKATPPKLPNLIFHGEQNFDATLAFIKHADIGLAPYLDRPGVEYQTTNSNRILLYRYFGLPVLGPDRLCHGSVPSIIGYGDPNCWQRCEIWDRQPEDIPDWSELARRLVE